VTPPEDVEYDENIRGIKRKKKAECVPLSCIKDFNYQKLRL